MASRICKITGLLYFGDWHRGNRSAAAFSVYIRGEFRPGRRWERLYFTELERLSANENSSEQGSF